MKYKLLFFSCACLLSFSSLAQDKIIKKNGEEIEVKVTTITEKEVSFKRFSNLDGPVYIVSKKELLSIHYQNGENETFVNMEEITDTSKNQKTRSNSIFADLGGNGMYISLNYERLFRFSNNAFLTAKIGFTPLIVLNAVNATATYNIGDGFNFLEVGGGVGYHFYAYSNNQEFRPYFYFTPTFGYRRMSKSGFLFRSYISMFTYQDLYEVYTYETKVDNYGSNYYSVSSYSYGTEYKFYPLIGISMGYSF